MSNLWHVGHGVSGRRNLDACAVFAGGRTRIGTFGERAGVLLFPGTADRVPRFLASGVLCLCDWPDIAHGAEAVVDTGDQCFVLGDGAFHVQGTVVPGRRGVTGYTRDRIHALIAAVYGGQFQAWRTIRLDHKARRRSVRACATLWMSAAPASVLVDRNEGSLAERFGAVTRDVGVALRRWWIVGSDALIVFTGGRAGCTISHWTGLILGPLAAVFHPGSLPRIVCRLVHRQTGASGTKAFIGAFDRGRILRQQATSVGDAGVDGIGRRRRF